MDGGAILVVDDDSDQAHLLAELLRLMGYEVFTAHSGAQGLAALRERRFFVVLTDHHMPGKTGCAMLAEAKAAGLLDHTGALVLTSAPDDVVGWRALSKTTSFDVLLAELESFRVA